jgi:cysteine desulfurase
MPEIYLDNNATTRIDPEVLEEMLPYLRDAFGNASSVHAAGRRSRRAVEEAREQVAELLGASEPDEIVFTSGGTESDTAAVEGAAAVRAPGRILLCAAEHPAVVRAAERLEGRGFTLERLPLCRSGEIDLGALEELRAGSAACVCVMAANNEFGGVFPVARIGALCRARGILFHTDAVQAAGKVPFDVVRVGADLASVSAHKIHGPKGVGALYVRKGVDLPPLLPGGGQERGRRGGTENVAAIVGFGAASRLARQRRDSEGPLIAARRNRLEERIRQGIPGALIWGEGVERLPNTSAVSFPGASGQSILIRLDLEGILVSVGSACSSGTLAPSPAILALGASPEEALGTVRFSLSRETTDAEIERVAALLPDVARQAGCPGPA